jgi:Protein of unknown function (DUF3376)
MVRSITSSRLERFSRLQVGRIFGCRDRGQLGLGRKLDRDTSGRCQASFRHRGSRAPSTPTTYKRCKATGTKGGAFHSKLATRISPKDATCLINENDEVEERRKLAGTSLRNFGAFMDRGWRQNDLLWGRLDGAERIITTLLSDPFRQQERDDLIKRAQRAILAEELRISDQDELLRLFADVLTKTNPTKESETRLREFVNRAIESPIDSALGPALRSLLTEERLREFFRDSYEVNREMDPKMAVRGLSRSTRVVGEMLEDISNQYQVDGKSAAWLTRLGRVFWGLVEVAVPRSLPNLLFRHWVKLLYLFEFLLIAGGWLFVAPQAQRFGFIALGITLAAHGGVLALGDWMRHKSRRWKRASQVLLTVALTALIVAVLLLALVGADTLFDLRGRTALF